jgi:hypothetical protein
MNMLEMKQLFNFWNVDNLKKQTNGIFWGNETMDKFNKLDQNTIPRSDAIDEDEKLNNGWKPLIKYLIFLSIYFPILKQCVCI